MTATRSLLVSLAVFCHAPDGHPGYLEAARRDLWRHAAAFHAERARLGGSWDGLLGGVSEPGTQPVEREEARDGEGSVAGPGRGSLTDHELLGAISGSRPCFDGETTQLEKAVWATDVAELLIANNYA